MVKKTYYDVRVKETETVSKALRDALKSTGITYERFIDISLDLFTQASFKAVTDPEAAGKAIAAYVELVFRMGIKYALENPDKCEIIQYTEEEEEDEI